jgi:RecA-family ATPase
MTDIPLNEADLMSENLAELFGLDTTTTPETGAIEVTREQEDPRAADAQLTTEEQCAADGSDTNAAEVVDLAEARAAKPQGIKRLAEKHRARCAAEIQPRDIDWFWKPYLPRGMLSLLDGDPGCGKSFVTLALAAALSTGRSFPGATGRPGKPRSTLICSAEDTAEEIIVPRLKSLGADLSLIHLLDSKNLDRLDDSGKRILEEHLKDLRPHLFILDTIVAYLPQGVGTQQATDVRPTLRWIADRAAEFQTCGILLRHLRKAESDNALHAGQGSMDFIGVARSCLLAAPDPTEGRDARVFVLAHNKINIAAKGGSWRYTINETGSFEWLGPSPMTATDLVRRRTTKGPDPTAKVDAAEWLVAELLDGPRRAAELKMLAEKAGITEITLKRAKKELGVIAEQATGQAHGGWTWELLSRS